MNRSKLEKLFGRDVEIEELKSWTEEDVTYYLIQTGYDGDPTEIVASIQRVIAASAMGSAKSERKTASSQANGRKGGRPRKSE